MFWKKENTAEKKLEQVNDLLKKSFENVKRDTTNIFQWLNHFHKKTVEQEQMIRQLQAELSYMPKTRDEIRRIIDDYYSFENIMSKMREMDRKIQELELIPRQTHDSGKVAPSPQSGLYAIERRLESLEKKKMSVKEKIIKKLTRNSKDYVKSVIISYIRKYGKISALQLKDIVVDEQNFCSKSSFYRLLEEIEESEDIGVIRQGKEKHYLSKAASHRLL